MSKARQLAQKPSQPTGRKNMVYNPAMTIAQRGTSETGVTSRGYHACDRWHLGPTSHGTYTISQSTDAPNGFGSSLKIDCTTADGSIDAGSSFMLEQRLEGQDLQHIGKGTSSAKKVTVSFYVKSNLTSTFICELFDLDNSRHINQTFSISAADTWERKELTFDIETSNTLDNDSSRSLDLRLFLAAGSNFTSGTLQTSWGASTTSNRAVGITADIGSSTSNDFYITGVQLEVGSTATEFEHRSYGEELLLCQRYYYKHKTDGIVQYGGRYSTGSSFTWIPYPVVMRATPTGSYTAVRTTTGLLYSPYSDEYGAQVLMTADNGYVSGWKADAEL